MSLHSVEERVETGRGGGTKRCQPQGTQRGVSNGVGGRGLHAADGRGAEGLAMVAQHMGVGGERSHVLCSTWGHA